MGRSIWADAKIDRSRARGAANAIRQWFGVECMEGAVEMRSIVALSMPELCVNAESAEVETCTRVSADGSDKSSAPNANGDENNFRFDI